MVLEITNVFGGGIDSLTEGSPILSIIKSPYGISLIVVLIIMLIWYIFNGDEENTVKDIVKAGLYMFISTVLVIMVHDHVINKDVDATKEEEEIDQIMPKSDDVNNMDNAATLERIRNNFTQDIDE